MRKKSIILSIVLVVAIVSTVCFQKYSMHAASANYGDAMLKATQWFDANRCGTDVDTNNVFSSWRSACHTKDTVDGGFHDAGDHVKFALPAAFSASAMGWSMYEFKSQWDSANATSKAWQELKIFSDYFMKCWNGSTMVVQEGDGGADHGYWGPPESQSSDRPSYKSAGSDILGQTAGALALMAINYNSVDSSYASKCLSTAKQMFNVGKSNMSTRSTVANGFYTSSSNYDDMTWAAIWLYTATKDNSYLSQVDSWMDIKNDSGDNPYQKPWTYCWDDSTLANCIMMYKITGNEKYYDGIMWNLKWFTTTLQKSPAGLPYLSNWGVLRYGSAEAGLAYIMYKEFGISDFNNKANFIIDYALGANPSGTSFLTNYGSKSIKHPHHRANEPNRDGKTNGMVGALAGGPNSDDSFTDDVNNYTNNEVALDYNASFLLGCAGRKYVADGGKGGTPKPTPTPAETSKPGSGDGLKGEYYTGMSLEGTPVFTKVDKTINLDWTGGSPDSSVPNDSFSARWTGQIEAMSNETYTFYLSHDDGARMWVNNVKIIDNWNDHASTENIGTIELEKGKKYSIIVEYYENYGDASCQLAWSTPTAISKEVVPQTQLYSGITSTATPTKTPTQTFANAPTQTPTQTPTQSSKDKAEYSVDYSIVNEWGNGATTNVTINNNGKSTIDGWTISWTFSGSEKVNNLWSGDFTQSSQLVNVKNTEWNSVIPANGSISFGFNMSYNGQSSKPTSFTIK